MIYNINGNGSNVAYDVHGNALSQCYDIHGNPLMGEHKPVKNYSYEADQDPDKSIVWSYSISSLRREQGNCFTIGIQTDTHFVLDGAPASYNNYNPPQSPNGSAYVSQLKNMTKRLYFDFIANLGDIPHGWGTDYETPAVTEDANEEIMRRYTSFVECPVLIARGNHDPGMYQHGKGHPQTLASVVPKATLYAEEIGGVKSTTGIVEASGQNFYYYKDFEECRVIVLDTNDYPFLAISEYDVHGNHHTLSAAQVAWFTDVALNTSKPVLILSHSPLVSDVRSASCVIPSEDKAYDNCVPYRADAIISALSEFTDNGGTVVACLSGHIHDQKSAVVNGVNHITFGDGGEFAEILFVNFDTRTINTKIIGTKRNNQREPKDWQDRLFAF